MQALELNVLPIQNLDKLRDLLRLLDELRRIDAPLSSPEGLREALTVVLKIGQHFGLDQRFIDRVQQVLDDPRVFEIVLALIRLLGGFLQLSQDGRRSSMHAFCREGQTVLSIQTSDFMDWLPFVLQLLDLVRRLLERR